MVFFQNSENRDFMISHKTVTGDYDLLPGSGVNLAEFVFTEYPKTDIINFIFVGRIMKEKGIDQYLDAAKYTKSNYLNICFHVFGAYEEDYKSIFEKCVQNDLIVYHGAVHFQLVKQQAKLVRCISGHVYDVIVDLRPNSPTFGKWLGFDLSGDIMFELFVPQYFGHGYLVLEDSIVSYKCGEVFYGDGDSGIMYNDKDINITWSFDKIGGFSNLIISEKDLHLMSFENYKKLEIGEI